MHMATPRISLDQWTALVSVVESGGYAKAGEHLHKSQSTLTYAIQNLEESVGGKVFEIRGRKAVLTPTGEVLYRRGKTLVEEAARLEHAAGELAKGWEPEIRLAVEIIFSHLAHGAVPRRVRQGAPRDAHRALRDRAGRDRRGARDAQRRLRHLLEPPAGL